MTHRFVQIIADDLTGALDAAAPFASAERPVRLLLTPASARLPNTGIAGVSVSSESRDHCRSDSTCLVDQAFERLRRAVGKREDPCLYFAKVDSVLRGHPVSETQHRQALWGLSRCLFAPAFPEMGRRTLNGRQEMRMDGHWRPAFIHDLHAAFATAGTTACLRRPGDSPPPPEHCVVIGDAATSQDLADHVSVFDGDPSLLWAGSRGLANALAEPHARPAMPDISSLIVGTTHPTTRLQIDALRTTRALDGRRLIDPAATAPDTATTHRHITDRLAGLKARDETGLFVTGGDTLACVCRSLEIQSMLCCGEVAPGLPLTRIEGGPLDGLALVTKSGGFGHADLMVDLLTGGLAG